MIARWTVTRSDLWSGNFSNCVHWFLRRGFDAMANLNKKIYAASAIRQRLGSSEPTKLRPHFFWWLSCSQAKGLSGSPLQIIPSSGEVKNFKRSANYKWGSAGERLLLKPWIWRSSKARFTAHYFSTRFKLERNKSKTELRLSLPPTSQQYEACFLPPLQRSSAHMVSGTTFHHCLSGIQPIWPLEFSCNTAFRKLVDAFKWVE